jgi:large subunit ribosomal protein L21
MYAIVEIAGLQYKVQKDQRVYVHRLEGNEGDKVKFDRVLLAEQKSTVTVGAPVIKGASVTASILGHVKADKVIIFKKKRRKGYEKKTGHRQPMTQISVTDIQLTASKKTSQSAKSTADQTPKVETKKSTKKVVASKKVLDESPKKSTKKPVTIKKSGDTVIKKPVKKAASNKADSKKA